MIIKATEEQIIAAACKAIAASCPMGMGFLHYSKVDDSPNPEEVKKYLYPRGIHIDYFNGRMVKFHLQKIDENTWEGNDRISIDYQSWCLQYPSYERLFEES